MKAKLLLVLLLISGFIRAQVPILVTPQWLNEHKSDPNLVIVQGLKGQVSFLNGGLDAWKKEGYSVTNEVPIVKNGTFKVKTKTLLVDKEYVQKVLRAGVVVDARMPRFYDGEPTGYLRNGHITGAKNIPYTELVNNSNRFKPVDSLQAYFAPVVHDKKNEVVIILVF